jgi:DNA-binding Xre family transcriptional regulator
VPNRTGRGGIATTTTPDTVRALAAALGCPVNDLVEIVDGTTD